MNGMYEELLEKLRKNNRMSGWTHIDRLIDEAAEAIKALQQENNGWQERYYELDAGHSRLFKDFCKLQKENEQLQAQVARMREALIFTKEKIYEQLSNYVNDPKKFKYSAISIECVQKIVRALADASDYHSPADAEALRKAREALVECIDALELCTHNELCKIAVSPYDMIRDAKEALAEIDKAIGGKEDV